MDNEREDWIKKHAQRVLESWRTHIFMFEISGEYKRQIELEMAAHYDNPLEKQFVETTWSD